MMLSKRILLAAAGLSLLNANAQAPAPVTAQPAATVDPAIAFGARENVEFVALSPDGSKIAYSIPIAGQGSRLYWTEVGGAQPHPITNVDGVEQRITRCGWVSNRRLVCQLYRVQEFAGYTGSGTRFVAMDIDGGNPQVLNRTSGPWGGNIVDWLQGQDNQILMLTGGQNLRVIQIDTLTGREREIEGASMTANGYISDSSGHIRGMRVVQRRGATERASNEIIQFYRPAGGGEWVRLGVYNSLTRQGPWILDIDSTLNAAYIMEQNAEGRVGIYRMALDGSGRRDLTVAHPDVDIDGLITLGRRGRAVGVTYATERRQSQYFDPELQRVAQQLSRALPGQPLINFMDASDDERRLLIWAGSDNDPGTYYVLDRTTRQMTRVMRARPELDGVTLATVRPITYRAADGTMVPGYLTLPPGSNGRGLPAIVMPHGGPSARDEWGFDWLSQYFASRGYAVLQPNFRGSAGYGSDWFQTNGFQSWRTAIGDVNDAGRWLISEGIADPSRLAIVGWSYGGYAALQSPALSPDLFKAIVAIAPVTDLQMARDEYRRSYLSANYRDFFGTGPHIQEGSPVRHAAAFRVPVLMFHGELDLNVEIRHARAMRDRLRDAGKQVELVEYPGLDHQLQDSAIRAQMLRRTDAFLRQTMAIR